ncbi:MFS transporter [Pontibacter sp. KCTC 32443]|uniref:MFS transporter n=1 Tax=Pontibacter TaxID=323449 RepID=UPI00164DA96A|nr:MULTISPECIES: MFS transporter [Pontibacter]MBC5775376.1 MFS transporter [Pontibacter sp. KCTC 32443]
MKYITKAIWILSVVSLLTDTASEMLYPVMPIYLKKIGFSVLLIGVLEGIAEATAGLSKGYFGKLSDVTGRRVPFVQLGYTLSAVSKPMLALLTYPLWIFFARTLDRFGKGIRTGARDAILSDEATPATKGKVFGFHRGMDTLGAVLGPGLALLYLYFYPEDYTTLFYIAFIPGLLAILASLLLKEKVASRSTSQARPSFFSFLGYWKESPPEYRRLVAGLLAFTLFNSSDVFLLLKMKQTGISDTAVIGIYIFYNLVYALFAFPAGIVADKIGLKKMFILGLVLFAGVYFGVAAQNSLYVYLLLFLLYGMYAAATEGISKAWISNITSKQDTATAIGTYSGFQSICTMLASSLAGLIWYNYGAPATFILTGTATVLVILYLLLIVRPAPATV